MRPVLKYHLRPMRLRPSGVKLHVDRYMEAIQQSRRLLDYRDAIRDRDPVCRSAGLALDFVTRMVSAPMAMFLVNSSPPESRLTVIKVDPILGVDSEPLGTEYLETLDDGDPILEAANGRGRVSLVGTQVLVGEPAYEESLFSSSFLSSNGLGPIVILYLRDGDSDPDCVLVLIRSNDEPDFNERERGFLRHAAPVLAQSYHSAMGMTTAGPARNGAGDLLTAREFEVANMAAGGARNEEIAQTLHISAETVKTHIRNIYSKLDVDSRVHLSLRLSGH